MAKQFEIELGGKTHRLSFTSSIGIALFKRFGRPLAKLLLEDCLGLVNGKAVGDINPEAQVALIAAGIRQPEDKVCGWLDSAYASGKTIGDFVGPTAQAAFYSGIIGGKSIDITALPTDDEDAEGKAPTSPADPSTDPKNSTTT